MNNQGKNVEIRAGRETESEYLPEKDRGHKYQTEDQVEMETELLLEQDWVD